VTLRDELELRAPQLYRFACALVCGQAETCAKAADLVRAVLSAPLQGSIGWRPTGDSLRICLYSRLIEWHRHRLKLGGLYIKVHTDLGSLQLAGPNIDGSAAVKASPQDNLAAALLNLGLEEREALLLVAREGFTYIQAARILKISRPVLVSRLARARAALSEFDRLGNLVRTAKPRPSHIRLIK